MKQITAILLSALILCASAALTGCDKNGSDKEEKTSSAVQQPSETSTSAKQSASESSAEVSGLQKIIQDYGFEGMAYAVKNGEVILSYGEGTLDNGEPITVDTPMPIASVSKQFCAAAILKLRDDGKLSLDDTLDKYFPEYEQAGRITLKNLLSMRSGIPNYSNDLEKNYVSSDKTAEENKEQLLKWMFSKPLDFEPDNAYSYSNSNYYLLSCIVEKTSGQKYRDYVRENIFKPLGMKNTGFVSELDDKPEWSKGVVYEIRANRLGIMDGAGDIVSTGTDMALWMKGLSGGKLISAKSFDEMCTDYSSQNGYSYGYAFFLNINGGIGHSGNIQEGYIAYDYINTKSDVQIFLATNTVGLSTVEKLMLELSKEASA